MPIAPMPFLHKNDSKASWKNLVPPGLEPGTFRVLSERDNHYTMELCISEKKSKTKFENMSK